MKISLSIILFLTFYNTKLTAQTYRSKSENYFGIQVKPIIPIGLLGDKSFDMVENGFETTISPIMGYSFGGVVRVGFTELLAIETGINYTRRNYKASYSVPDSNVYAEDDLGYVSFDIPLNFLVYIKLGKQIYMNVGIGASGNFNASNIRSLINPEGKHLFIFEGKRYNYFDFNANADLGFEYRTHSSGTIYLGLSSRVPFSPALEIATAYEFGTYKTVAKTDIDGSTFALCLKYFFHNQKRKKGVQFEQGPIEQ